MTCIGLPEDDRSQTSKLAKIRKLFVEITKLSASHVLERLVVRSSACPLCLVLALAHKVRPSAGALCLFSARAPSHLKF